MQPYLTDAALTVTGALPASTTFSISATIDTGNTKYGDQTMDRAEWEVQAPALTTAALPDTKTMSYSVWMSNNADGSSATLIYDNVTVQTGAGGVGAVAATARFRLPLQPGGLNNAFRYLLIRATPSAAGAGNASTFNMTLLPRF